MHLKKRREFAQQNCWCALPPPPLAISFTSLVAPAIPLVVPIVPTSPTVPVAIVVPPPSFSLLLDICRLWLGGWTHHRSWCRVKLSIDKKPSGHWNHDRLESLNGLGGLVHHLWCTLMQNPLCRLRIRPGVRRISSNWAVGHILSSRLSGPPPPFPRLNCGAEGFP